MTVPSSTGPVSPAPVPSPAVPPALGRVRRWSIAVRLTGLVVGLSAAVVVAGADALGRGMALAAPVLGLCLLAGVIVGEFYDPTGPTAVRRASLEVRRVRHYLPRALSVVTGAGAGLFAVLLATTTALGSPDDLGRPGRALTTACAPDGRAVRPRSLAALLTGGTGESRGPWAGSFYTVPLAVLVALGLAAAGLALWCIVRRPRPVGASDDPTGDDLMRRDAARTVVGACAVLIAVPGLAVAVLSAGQLARIGCRPAGWASLGWALGATVPLWAALGIAGAVALWPRAVRADTAADGIGTGIGNAAGTDGIGGGR